jgi:hypothetical protein
MIVNSQLQTVAILPPSPQFPLDRKLGGVLRITYSMVQDIL